MPRNRISTLPDGRRRYRITDASGKQHLLTQWKDEGNRAFSRRCDALDKKIDLISGRGDIQLDDLFAHWDADHLAHKSNAHQSSMNDVYRLHIKPHLGHYSISDVTQGVIYKTLKKMIDNGHSKAYIAKARSCLSGMFRYGAIVELCLFNPVAGIKLSYTAKNKRVNPNRAISQEDLDTFFKVSKDTKYHNLYTVMLRTGLRPSEALALKWSDIEGDLLNVRRGITKQDHSTGKTDYAPRTIPLDVDTLQALKEQRNSSLWVFPAATGTPSFNALRKSFTYIQRRIAPTQITLYSFRHTFATRCSRAGMAPTTLQYLMGHESITVTQKYYIDIEKEDLTIARRIIENAF